MQNYNSRTASSHRSSSCQGGWGLSGVLGQCCRLSICCVDRHVCECTCKLVRTYLEHPAWYPIRPGLLCGCWCVWIPHARPLLQWQWVLPSMFPFVDSLLWHWTRGVDYHERWPNIQLPNMGCTGDGGNPLLPGLDSPDGWLQECASGRGFTPELFFLHQGTGLWEEGRRAD